MTNEPPSMKTVRNYLRRLHKEEAKYWQEHPENWKLQEEQICPLCGHMRSGYPFVWCSVPVTETIASLKIGTIPDLICPDCYASYLVQTELWSKASEEVVLQMFKDRNWRLWLEKLEKTGYHSCSIGGDKERWAFVVQLYARDGFNQPEPSQTFSSVSTYLVAIPDALTDPYQEEMVSVLNILTGDDFAEIIRGEDELREFLRLGPEAWHAQKDEGLLTAGQAAERLSVKIATIYEYCRNFFRYGEYGPMSEPLEEEPPKKRTSLRKLFNVRTLQGEIRIPVWAIDLFLMQYGKEDIHVLTTKRSDVRILLGDKDPYDTWRGDKGEETISWLPRFEFQTTEGGKRPYWSRRLVGITEVLGNPAQQILMEEYEEEDL